ncbi:hypothetical protein I4U23_018166 [Adineta vaga]|nr:hypothetical protein I4U23_018166 [Adineta vaga]
MSVSSSYFRNVIFLQNGGVALAMKGKECIAIACDKRYGVQNKTIATNFTRIFQNLYELREQRKLKPNLLYERRFEPYLLFALVGGLDPKTGETFVYDSDNIGELFSKPNMNPNELFEATSQALLNGVDRYSASGWGAVVYVTEKDKITVRELKISRF